MAINLAGRVPTIRQATSPAFLWLVGGLFALVLVAVAFGFYYRIRRQEAQKESQQEHTIAADASTSNRVQIEGPDSSGLPVTPKAVSIAPAAPPVQPATYQPYRPTYYPGATVARVSPQERLLRSERERLQAAMDAPTGAPQGQGQGQGGFSAPPTGYGPGGGEWPEMAPLLRQPAPGTMPGVSNGSLRNQFTQDDPNGQLEKRLFAEGTQGDSDYLKTTRTPPLSPWVVQRGTVIPAALPNKIVSDLPGDLIAEVVRDVYDSPTQKYVEIPAGSRLVGEYNSSVTFGQDRVQVVWTAIYFPDGSYIDLDRFPSHAADGATGLRDQTDNHWNRVIGGVALSSLFAAGIQVSQNRTNGSVLSYPSTGQVIASGVGAQASQLGEQITNRNLSIQPTLKIRPGELFAVSVKRDIVFGGPYQPMEAK
jgi:type IV secretory pathway VirB10-like protein